MFKRGEKVWYRMQRGYSTKLRQNTWNYYAVEVGRVFPSGMVEVRFIDEGYRHNVLTVVKATSLLRELPLTRAMVGS